MFDYLDKLRAKPTAVKRQIALFISGGVTFFVALLWWGSFWGAPVSDPEKELTVQEALSPMEGVLVSLKAAKDITSDGIKKLTDAASTTMLTNKKEENTKTESLVPTESESDTETLPDKSTMTAASASADIPATTTWR